MSSSLNTRYIQNVYHDPWGPRDSAPPMSSVFPDCHSSPFQRHWAPGCSTGIGWMAGATFPPQDFCTLFSPPGMLFPQRSPALTLSLPSSLCSNITLPKKPSLATQNKNDTLSTLHPFTILSFLSFLHHLTLLYLFVCLHLSVDNMTSLKAEDFSIVLTEKCLV